MYSGIKSSRNGYRSIAYPMTDKRSQNGVRIGEFRCGGGIIDTGDIAGIRRQFARVWKKGKREVGDIQAYTVLYSFSEKELDPRMEDSMERAADIVVPAIERMYAGHQYTLVAQKDGKGGKVHVHVTVNALDGRTLKACRGRQTSYLAVREEIESEMLRQGIEPDYGKNHAKAEKKQQRKLEGAKQKDNGYAWTQDLAARIQRAIDATWRFSDLEDELERQGVGVARKTKTSWTFVLKEAADARYNNKKARGDRLLAGFSPGEMRRAIDRNYEKKMREDRNSDYVKRAEELLRDICPQEREEEQFWL